VTPPNPDAAAEAEVRALCQRALAHHTLSVSDLVAVFEDARAGAAARRRQVLRLLDTEPGRRHGLICGVTGTPGSGKSTLLGRLALALADARPLSIAILAVDPSSPLSGGALLGDRVRVRFPPERPELYFRSQASETQLGGLAPDSFQVCRLLTRLFDLVLVETVGIGQSELDVRYLSDRMYLVLAPLGGDEVQLLKAGVMEVPDAIVVSKADETVAARRLMSALATALPLGRLMGAPLPPVYSTSARTGAGVDALAADVLATLDRLGASDLGPKELHFFRRWVRDEWGREGERVLAVQSRGLEGFLERSGDLDSAEERFSERMKARTLPEG